MGFSYTLIALSSVRDAPEHAKLICSCLLTPNLEICGEATLDMSLVAALKSFLSLVCLKVTVGYIPGVASLLCLARMNRSE